jgi:pimeloyl-ACP methyl ester carboxylesterase
VAGLVLLSGYYYASARPDVLPGSVPAIPLFGDLLAHTVAPLTGLLTGPAAVKASFAPAAVPDKFAELPAAMALRPSQVRATAADTAMMVPAAAALSRRYGELKLPVIVVAGEGDRIVHPDRHAERLAAEVESAELRVVPGQGHLFHYYVPEQVVAAIGELSGRAMARA